MQDAVRERADYRSHRRLIQLIEERCCSIVLTGVNGPEFVNIDLLQLAADRGLRNLLIEPDKLGRRDQADLQRQVTA